MKRRAGRAAASVVIAAGACTALLGAAASLHWRMVHDLPIMLYTGFLVSHGAVPYRDFFDMNMPGSHLLYAAFGAATNWSDAGIRVVDLAWLASLSALTLAWMRRFGWLPAAAAVTAFALWYLDAGPAMSLQREYIAMLPLAGIGALAFGARGKSLPDGGDTLWRFAAAGVLTGVCVLIKPQFVLLALPWLAHMRARRRLAAIAVMLLGFALPVAAAAVWLWANGAMGAFIDMAAGYLPLYGQLTEGHEIRTGFSRIVYDLRMTRIGLWSYLTPAALLGLWSVRAQRVRITALGAMLVLAAVYPSLSGQFWPYHWLPFTYAAICAAALGLGTLRPVAGDEPAASAATGRGAERLPASEAGSGGSLPALSAALLVLILAFQCADSMHVAWRSDDPRNPVNEALPAQVGAFLQEHLRPGDTVQPLDWTGGAVHGMLIARAPLATRFIYDFHFHHHLDNPYIRGLRDAFMHELEAARPRFIVDVRDSRPWPSGAGTSRDFAELRSFLASHYSVVLDGVTFRILENNHR